MPTIKLKIKEKAGVKWIVVDGKPNIKALPGEKITWSHNEKGLSGDFLVTFSELTTPDDWPFDGGSPPLRLSKSENSSVDVTLKQTNNLDWEYKAEVEFDKDIEKLDPMIIIRGRSSPARLALVAGVSLVTGLVIGLLWNM